MNILVVGGTRFVGRAIVEALLERGHGVTLFNRGTHPDVLPTVPRIVGDRGREDDLAQLRGPDWDCVVDVSGYRPGEVRSLLSAVGDTTRHYLYISTVSVYAHPVPPRADEEVPTLSVDESTSSEDPRSYGGLKMLCERAAAVAVGDRLTVLRPTVVVGPHDYTDRFGWWVRHVARGGRMQVPSRLDQPVQLVDARDLGAFAALAVDRSVRGTFNVVGPDGPLTLGGMIDLLATTLGSRVDLEPVDPDPAATPFPLTLPSDGTEDGVFMVSGAAAKARGLTLRPLADSALAVNRHLQRHTEPA
jgi:2'-hydroxyisoflavone reductase